MAEDRRAVLAEQQASMERLVSLISASINRDLPLRMEELVRAEVSHKLHTKAVLLSYAATHHQSPCIPHKQDLALESLCCHWLLYCDGH